MTDELDEIERVLDHAEGKMDWELTDEEIKAICKGCAGTTTHWACVVCRAKADAAVKKYQEWLAKQCGGDPCKTCKVRICHISAGRSVPFDIWQSCVARNQYIGRLQGYAQAMQERGK